MIPAVNSAKIFSTLGNDKSLVPMAIKDIANSCGLTAGSYITGDTLEGKDRFIDEFGTQAIWLFGIPAYKKIIDYTLYKALKIDPKFDVRNLKEHRKSLLEKSVEFSDSSIKNSIKAGMENTKFTKNLAMGKFIVSTALTIASYWGLTKYRHKYTQKAAKKEILKELQQNNENKKDYSYTKPKNNLLHNIQLSHSEANKKEILRYAQNDNIAEESQINKSNKQPSFTGSVQDFMYNPVKNLMILDGAITTERLAHSRNRQDLMGYTIKEGTFWAFMYFASKPIQKFLEKTADKNTKKPTSIELDSRVIESKELEKAFKDGTLKASVEKVLSLDTSEKLMDYAHENPDDFVVQMAKKSDVLPVLKNALQADNIDYRKFIYYDEFKEVAKKLDKLNKKFEAFKVTPFLKDKDNSLDAFLKNVKNTKRMATLANIGSCIGVLGVLAPLIMVMARKFGNDNQEFKVKEDLKKQMLAEA